MVNQQRIRELDDETKPVAESAKAISKQLKTSYDTIRSYIRAKRRGFSSHAKYLYHLAKQRGTTINRLHEISYMKRGFKSQGEYDKYILLYQTLEYDSLDEYLLDLAEEHGLSSVDELMEQMPEKSFEPWLTLTDSREILERPCDNNSQRSIELAELIEDTLKVLDEREQRIIRKIFYEGQTSLELEESLGYNPPTRRVAKFKVLEKLRKRAKINGLEELR